MPTTTAYFSVFTAFVIEAWALALLSYALVWHFVRGNNVQRVQLGRMWHLAGFLATMVGTGGVRFLSIFIIGGKAALELTAGRGIGMFFFVAVPILLAIGICTFLKTKASPVTKAAPIGP